MLPTPLHPRIGGPRRGTDCLERVDPGSPVARNRGHVPPQGRLLLSSLLDPFTPLSHFSLIPTSQTQYHPNARCSEAARQDSEVQLGCFTSPKPISKQNTSLTADGSGFTVSCLHPTQGEVQLEVDSADHNPRETQGGRTYTGAPCSTPGPLSLFSVSATLLAHPDVISNSICQKCVFET